MRQSVANLGVDGELARAVAEMDVQLGARPGSPPAAVEHPPADPYVHFSRLCGAILVSCRVILMLNREHRKDLLDARALPELPPPILAHMLCYLGCPHALSNARLVSRHWREVASSDELWSAMYFALAAQTSRHSSSNRSPIEGGWRRRTALAWMLGQPHAVSIRPVWGGLDGRLFGAPRSGHAAAVYRPRVDSAEQCLLVGGATTNYAYRRDADIFMPAGGDELDTENCLGRLPAPPIDASNVLAAWSARWLHTASVVHLPASATKSGLHNARNCPGMSGVSGGGSTGSPATPRRTAVLLLIGGQQQQHVHAEVHRLELSTAGMYKSRSAGTS